jgi:hypothetical protein
MTHHPHIHMIVPGGGISLDASRWIAKNIRAFDGQRLPNEDWQIVRSIVLERDGHACTYCGAKSQLEGDHILPLARGGSNA